ncbi:MAG: glycosyltransferase, partial [Bacteroidales bacterium]|nr:glycosyltransferase [Bacteroidales bacterium]
MPKVSVIVPIYGVEQYIERCAKSLFEQTLDDMEFIFVDDCTKDKSVELLYKIIDKYPNRRQSIFIIHHKINKGLPTARETGLKYATGDYFAHCDSDDWVDHRMYQLLYEHACRGNYDVVNCNYFRTDGINNKIISISYEEGNKKLIISKLIACQNWNTIWNKLVSRKIYERNNIQFPKETMLEDFVLTTQLLTYADRIGMIEEPLYFYYINSSSICGINNKESVINKSKQAMQNVDWILDFIRNIYPIGAFEQETIVLKYVPKKLLIPIMGDL